MNQSSVSSTPLQSNTGTKIGLVPTLWLVAALRACILCTGLLSIAIAPPDPDHQFMHDHPWMAWDAQHYYELAEHGYSPDMDTTQTAEKNTFSLAAYFPALPLAGWGLSYLVNLDVGLILISNVCSIIGFGFMYDWARRLSGQRAAFIAVLLVATFPGAVSFATGTTDGPFFMFVAICLWLLQRDRFYLAAVVVGIASASRPTAVALAIVVPLYALIHLVRIPWPRRLATAVVLGLICISGILVYEAFLWHRYKTPTAYFEAQKAWGEMDHERMHDEEVQGVKRYTWEFIRGRLTSPQAWNRIIALVLAAVTLAGLLWPGETPRVFFLLPLIILVQTTLPDRGMRVSSLPRYESGAVPLFMLAATWLSTARRHALTFALLLLQFGVQCYYAALFPRQIWVG